MNGLLSLNPLWLLAVPGLVAVFLWALVEVERFALFVLIPATMLPQPLLTPGGALVAAADALLLVVLATWIVGIATGRVGRPWIRANTMVPPVLLFVGMNVVSYAWSDNHSATLKFALQLFEIAALFLIVFSSLPTSVRTIRQALWIYVCGASMLSVAYLVGVLDQIQSGFNKNVVGTYAAAGLVVAFTFFTSERRPRVRVGLGLVLLAQGAALVVSYSRGSMVGAVLSVVMASVITGSGRKITALVVLAAVITVAVYGFGSRVNLQNSGSYSSTTLRVSSYDGAIRKIKERPFLGTGGGTYDDYIAEAHGSLPDPNNTVLLTLAELGIPGGLALCFLYWRFGRSLWSVRRLEHPQALGTAAAAGCVAISLFAHFMFDVTWTRGTSSTAFIMIGLMMAVLRLESVGTGDQSLVKRRLPEARAELRHPVGASA